jgi:hypothetical protein
VETEAGNIGDIPQGNRRLTKAVSPTIHRFRAVRLTLCEGNLFKDGVYESRETRHFGSERMAISRMKSPSSQSHPRPTKATRGSAKFVKTPNQPEPSNAYA